MWFIFLLSRFAAAVTLRGSGGSHVEGRVRKTIVASLALLLATAPAAFAQTFTYPTCHNNICTFIEGDLITPVTPAFKPSAGVSFTLVEVSSSVYADATCLVSHGTAMCFGSNDNGETGTGSNGKGCPWLRVYASTTTKLILGVFYPNFE